MATGLVMGLSGTALAQRAWKTPGESDAATARRLSSMGRCDEALAPFDAAVESRSGDATLRRDRGVCHEKLGHPAPAIDDYRAYLSMEPTAQDAASIRTRLDALEASEGPSGGSATPTAATTSAHGEPERDATTEKRTRPEGLPDSGDFTVALHIGDHAWSDRGYPEPTVAYGLAAAYAYLRAIEVDAHLVLLRTNVLHSSGFGAGVDNTFKLGLDASRRWEIGFALGLGFERESNDLRIPRNYIYGHVNPKLRFLVSGPIMLEAGPEFGTGLMDQEAQSIAETSSALTFFYGGYVRLGWVIRGK